MDYYQTSSADYQAEQNNEYTVSRTSVNYETSYSPKLGNSNSDIYSPPSVSQNIIVSGPCRRTCITLGECTCSNSSH